MDLDTIIAHNVSEQEADPPAQVSLPYGAQDLQDQSAATVDVGAEHSLARADDRAPAKKNN